ncbi:MAG: hypothetical protein RH917_14010 [Lacipirellulaceae bacterium]
MREPNRNEPIADFDTGSMIRGVIGSTLLIFGVCVGIWVLVMIGTAINAADPPGIITAIATDDGEPLKAVLDGKQVELPNKLMLIPAYFSLCLLLIVAASIAKGAISGGIALLLKQKRKG